MTCGAIGGVSLWTAVFPTDVVKSRIQVGGASGSVGEGSSQAFFPMLMNIARNEGSWNYTR